MLGRKLIIAMLIAWNVFALAAVDKGGFDPDTANNTLEQLTISLSTAELDVHKLQNAIDVLTDLKQKARDCVEKSRDELDEVNKQIKDIGQISQKTEELKYLESKKQDLEQLMSKCRLFDIRAEDVVSAFSKTVQQKLTSELLTRNKPVWVNIVESPEIIPTLTERFSKKEFLENSGIKLLNSTTLMLSAFLILLGIGLGYFVRYILREPLKTEPSSEFLIQIKYDLMSVLYRFVIYLLPILFMTVLLIILNHGNPTLPYLLLLGIALCTYCIMMMILRFLICPPLTQFSINKLPRAVSKKIVRRFHLLSILGVLITLIHAIYQQDNLPEQFYALIETIFIILISSLLVSIAWLVNQLPKLKYKYTGLRVAISIVLGTILLFIVGAEVFGYYNLAIHTSQGILLTILLSFGAWFVSKVVISFMDMIRDGTLPWHQQMIYYLGMRQNEQLTELLWLRLVAYVVIWGAYLGLLLQAWGLSEADDQLMYHLFVDGFQVADYHIFPGKIILGLLFFSFFVILTRFIRGYFLRQTSVVQDTSARFALSTIVGYIGFIAAAIIAMLIAGVDFTGIAIIAGALSVGVGFGMQNIVNNFVSGLILLVERPIKLGDRILVGTTEGYVRKISIRSTRIRTMDRTDVIVPNSELIAQQVTNMMFADRRLRVKVAVGVAYGSDVELVTKLLLEVANENENICQEEGHQPKVLFRAFGASSLDFELWCILTDANQINNVPSELHYGIDKAFREHHVAIPFPQQDVYIKEIHSQKLND